MCAFQLADRGLSPSIVVSNIIKEMTVKIHPRNPLVRWIYVSGYAFLVYRDSHTSAVCTIEGIGTLPILVVSLSHAKEAIAFEVIRLGDREPKSPIKGRG
jgi:hypothetical protein